MSEKHRCEKRVSTKIFQQFFFFISTWILKKNSVQLFLIEFSRRKNFSEKLGYRKNLHIFLCAAFTFLSRKKYIFVWKATWLWNNLEIYSFNYIMLPKPSLVFIVISLVCRRECVGGIFNDYIINGCLSFWIAQI